MRMCGHAHHDDMLYLGKDPQPSWDYPPLTPQGYANADVTFTLTDGGGTIHTSAQITGKAASMGEGVMVGVLDALIADFAEKLSAL